MRDTRCEFKVQSVIFDMDGVITNTMPDHFRAWHSVLRAEGLEVTHLDVYCREGQRGITSVRELFAEYKKPFDLKNAKRILLKKEKLFKRIVRKRFIPGARSFLHSLKRQGFRLALVTGTSRHELHHILPDRLHDLFEVTVTGNDVRHGKPAPDPYLLALKKLRIKSKEAVVIENAPFGIASAKAAGLRCIAVATSLPHEHLEKADLVFDSIRDLRRRVHFVKTP